LLLSPDRTMRREVADEARSLNVGPTCQAAECAGEKPDPAIHQ
jgi:hypothetical protein